jgi:hypothetical protein
MFESRSCKIVGPLPLLLVTQPLKQIVLEKAYAVRGVLFLKLIPRSLKLVHTRGFSPFVLLNHFDMSQKLIIRRLV